MSVLTPELPERIHNHAGEYECTKLDEAVRLLSEHRVAVLTGAGISTDSGIPDYRSPGTPKRTPMLYSVFREDHRSRQRYWAGSHLGWKLFSTATPNLGHSALATLEAAGVVSGVITQNVDGLHARAGTRHLVELHGNMHQVLCSHCGQIFARNDIAQALARDNPWLGKPDAIKLAPDGDVDTAQSERMIIPVCTLCGGMLRPDVVFFGEFVPAEVFRLARALLSASTALLVAGSSLVVNTGIRLVNAAVRRNLPVVIINRGVTPGDKHATITLNAGTSEVLTTFVTRLARGTVRKAV